MRGCVSVHRHYRRLTRLFDEGMSVWIGAVKNNGVCLVWQSLAILVFLLPKTAAANLCISWSAYWGLQCVITCVQTLIQNFQWSSIVITSKHFISLHGCWPCWVADVTMLSYLWYLDVNKLHALPYSCISPLCKALLATAACPSAWFLWTCAAIITFHTPTFCLLGRAASGMFRLLRTGWYQLVTLMSLLKVFLVRRCVSFGIFFFVSKLFTQLYYKTINYGKCVLSCKLPSLSLDAFQRTTGGYCFLSHSCFC